MDWEILNALSDDYESIEHIESLITAFSNISPTKFAILDRLEYLHEKCYVFLIMNRSFSRSKLEDEIENRTEVREFWFGRTENGYLAWQALTEKYINAAEQGAAANP